jgi:uroporphyrinogen-III synthase
MRVAITTAPDRMEDVAARFAATGLTPVPSPCVAIEAAPVDVMDEVRSAIADDAVLVLSSARTLDLIGSIPDAVAAFVVGGVTAAAVVDAGGRVEFQGNGGINELARLAPLDGRTVVFPHAAGTDAEAIELIRSRAGSLFERTVYRTVPIAPGDDRVEAAAFGSPSAVDGWLQQRTLDGLLIGAIGVTTAAALERAGHRPDVVASRPDFGVLAAEMASHLEVAR